MDTIIYTQLVEDPEFDDAIKVANDLKQSLRDSLSCRRTTLANLRLMKQEVEESYDISRKARIGGAVAITTGLALTVIGFGLTFVTFGASLGFTYAGCTMAAAGAATMGGGEVGYYAVSLNTLKQAEYACNVDREMMKKVENNGKKFTHHIESLAKKHNTSSEGIYDFIKSKLGVATKVGKGLYSGYKLIDD